MRSIQPFGILTAPSFAYGAGVLAIGPSGMDGACLDTFVSGAQAAVAAVPQGGTGVFRPPSLDTLRTYKTPDIETVVERYRPPDDIAGFLDAILMRRDADSGQPLHVLFRSLIGDLRMSGLSLGSGPPMPGLLHLLGFRVLRAGGTMPGVNMQFNNDVVAEIDLPGQAGAIVVKINGHKHDVERGSTNMLSRLQVNDGIAHVVRMLGLKHTGVAQKFAYRLPGTEDEKPNDSNTIVVARKVIPVAGKKLEDITADEFNELLTLIRLIDYADARRDNFLWQATKDGSRLVIIDTAPIADKRAAENTRDFWSVGFQGVEGDRAERASNFKDDANKDVSRLGHEALKKLHVLVSGLWFLSKLVRVSEAHMRIYKLHEPSHLAQIDAILAEAQQKIEI